MTQKADMFKGRHKKSETANRHGKAAKIRKGKMFKQPSKKSKSDEMNSEITKFINQANEIKAATVACKEGAQFLIVKPPAEVVRTSNKK